MCPGFVRDEDLLTWSSGIYGLLFVGNTHYTGHCFETKCKNRGSDPPMKCGGELGLHEGCGGNA